MPVDPNRNRAPRMALLWLLLVVQWSLAGEDVGNSVERAASEARLIESVKYLASNELEGRGVGTEGITAAADFIAEHFEQCGLKTELFDHTPFQEFTLKLDAELGAETDNFLTLRGPDQGDHREISKQLRISKDFSPLAIGGVGKFSGDLIFCGYGITAPKLGYDDYAGVDAAGKVVVLLRKEPQQDDPNSVFGGKDPSTHATFQRKLQNAAEHKAAAVIIVNDDLMIQKAAAEKRQALDKAIFRLVAVHAEHRGNDKSAPDDEAGFTRKVEELSKRIHQISAELNSDSLDQLMAFQQAGSRSFANIPLYVVSRRKIDEVLAAAEKPSLAQIEAQIDKSLKPDSFPVGSWRAEGSTSITTKASSVKNVVGALEGEGDLADETIVVGAHYDHLGIGGPGSLAPWTRDVHNGADDNASGTAALLELAGRLSSRPQKPKRRIVFIAFTGEERGLLGSAHYVRNPRFDLKKTVAMLNLDMVGRLTDNQLTIYGTGTAAEFDQLVDRINQTYKFELTKKPSGFGPSDHTSFYTRQVPVLFPFTGLHRDYHRPSDDWDKINVEGLRKVTDFSMDIIEAIEAMPQRPVYVKRGRLGFMFDGFRRDDRPRGSRKQREGKEAPTDGQPNSEQPAVTPSVKAPANEQPVAESPLAKTPVAAKETGDGDRKPE